MNIKNMIVVAGLVCSSFSNAYATGTDVYITGASAFRGALMLYLRSKLTDTRGYFDKALDSNLTKSIDASSFIVMSGRWNGAPTVRTTFYLSFTGSVAGIRDVAGPVPQTFLPKPVDFETADAYKLAVSPYGVKATVTKNADGSLAPPSFTHNPDFGFSDVFQASTIYTNPLIDTKVAVLPFTWITAPGGGTAGITNMTSQIAQQLFKTGTVSLSLFSGAAGDKDTKVYALGRTDDSGTRMTAMAETNVGVSSTLHQYYPVGNPVTSYTDVGNSGYVSGGDLQTPMKYTTTAANGFNASYMGISDADGTTGATYLSHNGVLFSTDEATAIAQVTEGKYTFWSYEHLFDRGDCTDDALAVLELVKSELPTYTASTRKTIRLDAMHVYRDNDGETVYRKGTTP